MSINNFLTGYEAIYEAHAKMSNTEKAALIEEIGMLNRAISKIDLPLGTEVQGLLEDFGNLLLSMEADLEYM